MVIIRKPKVTKPHTVKHQLKGLSTRGAFVCLMQQYSLHKKTFMWQGKLYTVESALKQIPDYLLNIQCDKFGVVRFYGGPPGNATWFDGTVLTMLCDATMFENHTTTLTPAQKLIL